MKSKGIIITPDHTSQSERPSYNQQYLRSCLLYWDMIDSPLDAKSDLHPFSNISDNDLLTKEGVLRRTKGHFFTKEEGHVLLTDYIEYPREFWSLAQIYAYEKNNNDLESWAIGQQGKKLHIDSSISRFYFVGNEGISKENQSKSNEVFFHEKYSNVIIYDKEEKKSFGDHREKNKLLEILLSQALPVPSENISVENILKFKRGRHAELQHFRYAMEELYIQISKSDFMMDEIDHVIDKIDLSLRDLKKVMDEGNLQSTLSSLISNIQIKDIVLGATTGAVLFDRVNLALLGSVLGATIGAVIPNLKIKEIKSVYQPKEIPEQYKDYAYLYFVDRELSR